MIIQATEISDNIDCGAATIFINILHVQIFYPRMTMIKGGPEVRATEVWFTGGRSMVINLEPEEFAEKMRNAGP